MCSFWTHLIKFERRKRSKLGLSVVLSGRRFRLWLGWYYIHNIYWVQINFLWILVKFRFVYWKGHILKVFFFLIWILTLPVINHQKIIFIILLFTKIFSSFIWNGVWISCTWSVNTFTSLFPYLFKLLGHLNMDFQFPFTYLLLWC